MKKLLTSFIFGTTALTTTMSFFPLADANADATLEPCVDDRALAISRVAPVKAVHDLASDLTSDLTVDPLTVSMISTGYEPDFEDISDDESEPKFVRKKKKGAKAPSHLSKRVGNFTSADAVEMLKYSDAAYSFAKPEEDKDIQAFKREGSNIYTLKPLKAEVSWYETTFENQDTGIFVERPDGTAILSFKGSDRLNTWLSDFYPIMMNHEDGGRYHGGFLTMVRELEASAWNFIMNFAEKNGYTVEEAMSKITITGHSRGAGAAQVFADIARRKTGVVSKLVTFAAPRALHKRTAGEFNKAAKDDHLNILQAKDIVGYAALGSLNGGAHTGHKVYLPVDKNSWMHGLGGYRKPLNTMHALGEVKRERDSATGNTYRFESYNADEKRDLMMEADNSVQAWVETGIEAVKDPKQAYKELSTRAEWAKNNPEKATERAFDTAIQVANNVGEVFVNAAKIGKLAAVGTVKRANAFITAPETKSAVKSVVSTVKSGFKKAYKALKFW